MLNQATQPSWDVVELIRDLGFPVVVAFYLLLRLEPRLRSIEQAVSKLSCLVELRPANEPLDVDPPP